MKNLKGLTNIPVQDLHYGLQYVEGVANGARNKMGEMLQLIKKEGLAKDDFSEDLEKLYKIFMEHDQASFMIEEELDKRFKPKFKLTYGAKTLLTVGKRLDAQMDKALQDKKEVPVKTLDLGND